MVYVYLAKGFEEIEALTPVDVLRRAGIRVETVSMEKDLWVTGSHGIPILSDRSFAESEKEEARALILPGGMPGAAGLAGNRALLDRLRLAHEKGTLICAICAAPMVLAKAGILEGRRAVIYPGMEGELAGACIGEGPVCVDGNLITSLGPATAMPFAFAVLESLADGVTHKRVKEGMLFND